MPARLEHEDGEARVSITGNATVPFATEIRDCLLEALGTGKPIVLDLSQLDRVDVSFVQIIISTAAALSSQGQTLRIEGDLEPLLDSVGHASAFASLLNEHV